MGVCIKCEPQSVTTKKGPKSNLKRPFQGCYTMSLLYDHSLCTHPYACNHYYYKYVNSVVSIYKDAYHLWLRYDSMVAQVLLYEIVVVKKRKTSFPFMRNAGEENKKRFFSIGLLFEKSQSAQIRKCMHKQKERPVLVSPHVLCTGLSGQEAEHSCNVDMRN